MELMCGRFATTSSPAAIAEYFGAAVATESLGANHNVAPTNDVYGVVADQAGERRLEAFHWGLVPSWAKERKIGNRMINARAETLATKPAFKAPFRKHRLIIPMEGFYEWQTVADAREADAAALTAAGRPRKQPFFIYRRDGEPLAVAGLWAAWKDPDAMSGDDATATTGAMWLHSATIVTTSANTTMRPVHDRMPVLLPRQVWDEWLDPDMHDLARLQQLLVPAPDDVLTMHPVSTAVNNVRNKGPELIVPIPEV